MKWTIITISKWSIFTLSCRHLTIFPSMIRGVSPSILPCRDTIWDLRVRAIEHRVISAWSHFTIWNAGKQGRKLYRSLSAESRVKVSTVLH